MELTSGLPGLDRTLKGILAGDSIVWQVDSVEDYAPFINPLARSMAQSGRKTLYYRFAGHAPLVDEKEPVKIVHLEPDKGFEYFINRIIDEIEEAGPGSCHIFDSLSDLAADWCSDRMLGNFFLLASSYLYENDSLAYFAIIRNRHSVHATDGIHEKAQVVLDVYRDKNHIYIHPLKVNKRHSPTMYMLHKWEGESFAPVTNSATISDILTGTPQPWLDFTIHRLGEWTRTFTEAEELQHLILAGQNRPEAARECFEKLLRMAISREDRFLNLARQHLTLTDLLDVRKRMIGTGLIGGKSVGMLIARAVLRNKSSRWKELLEAHDSFFIGSDVFFTYLVQNECWGVRRKQRLKATVLDEAEETRVKMLQGAFPKYIQDQFGEMLNYFGQTPIIVRSSSLMEDNYGNSFSGKYESVFCANQGSPQARLESFLNAVRRVYASTMSKEALMYRAQKGLLDQDEQMAILVQRVSGNLYNRLYFPQVAGVGYSFNPYVWSEEIDPHQGVLRLVFGLGTRAVDRRDDDYTRITALNAPMKRPESSFDEVRKYAQRKVDVLDLEVNKPASPYFEDIAEPSMKSGLPLDLFASTDTELERRALQNNMENVFSKVITFDNMFADTPFINDMREAMKLLQDAYDHPVDIEFTVNFTGEQSYRINLVQCRPFQISRKSEAQLRKPENIPHEKTFFEITGRIIGNSVSTTLDSLIFVVPSVYGKLTASDRYSVARLIGRLIREPSIAGGRLMLAGPGRWGTTTPALGVPVSFAEINKVSVLCEIAAMREGIIPDISLGTHFFNDLVELDILYLGVIPDEKNTLYNEALLLNVPNRLEDLLPGNEKWNEVVRVIMPSEEFQIRLWAHSMEQKAVCYLSDS